MFCSDRDRLTLSNRLAIFAGLMLVAVALWLVPLSAKGGEITWNAPFPVTSPADVMLPSGGTVHFAADFNTVDGFDPDPDDDDIINGIPFTRVDAAGIPGLLTHSFSSGPAFGAATFFLGGSGDADLDNLLDSHSYIGGDPGTASVTLQGLEIGAPYQIQVIGAADARACCSARAYEPDNGLGNFNTGFSYARGENASMIGTFVADGATQTFQWRSLNDAAGNNDPGLSGLVVTRRPGSITGVLSATLDRDTGNMQIENGTVNTLDILGYSVSSPFGSLSQTSWNTVSDNYDASGNQSIDDDDNWTVLSSPDSHTELSEAELNTSGPRNGGAIGAGQTLDFGNVWIKSPTEDVSIQVLRSSGQIQPINLNYTGNNDEPYQFGDLNFDNALTPADWNIFIANAQTDLSGLSGAERYQRGDFNDDGVNNLNDMSMFLSAYDGANGAGSGAALLAGTGVPEPSTCLLLLFSSAILSVRRLRGRISSRAATAWGVLATLVIALSAGQPARAALIGWEAPFTVDDNMDIIVPDGSSVHFAADFNTAADFGPDDGMINGIPFTQVDAAGIPGLLTHSFASGPNFGAAAFPGGTGDADLDNLMNSHSWMGGDPTTATVTIDGLTPGVPYQIQVVGVADTRACCSARTYEPDDGAGNFSTGVSYARGDLASMVGTFTADAPTQTFQWRSLDEATGNNDPGLSGLVVLQLAGVFQLDLQVNTLTGKVEITNPTELDFNLRGYEVTSAGGSLSTPAWTVPANWDKAGGASPTALEAGTLTDNAPLGPGETLSLGPAYDTSVDAQDLEFRYLRSDGGLRMGTVSYVSEPGSIPGDYDASNAVGTGDLNLVLDNWGDTVPPVPAGWTGDQPPAGSIGTALLNRVLDNWGNTAGAGAEVATTAAVPEPSTAVFVIAALVALLAFRHRAATPALAPLVSRMPVVLVVMVTLASFAVNQVAQASGIVDRDYSFGDDLDEHASSGIAVGDGPGNVAPLSTLDTSGPSGAHIDLERISAPTYIDVSTTSANLSQARPGAAPGSLGIRFDGVADFLRGGRLNLPSTSASSVAAPTPGPLDYNGLSNRGFQLWVYPEGPNPATAQSIVSDLDQHGVRINAAGNWEMRYNGAIVDSNRAAAFDQWSHIMVARPFGTAAPNGGSVLYLDGEAIAAAPGGYNGAPTPGDYLIVGGEPADDTGFANAEFFSGVLDDMNMLVFGTVQTGPTPAPGNYNFEFATDNTFAAMPAAVSGLSGVPGDVDQDGMVNDADIDALVAGWAKEKRINNVRVGDKLTIRDGDLNFDGITNLADVFKLHNALMAGTGSGFDFSRLPISVPELSTLGLVAVLLAASAGVRARRG